MFTHKDIANRSLFIINGLEHQSLKVSNGRLRLENTETKKAITNLPFPKILGLFIIGHTTVTTAFIEHCNKNGIPLVVMKPNFRVVFYFGNMAEANFLLRQKQYETTNGNISIAKNIILNKIENQKALLIKTREKNLTIDAFLQYYDQTISYFNQIEDLRQLMGVEGNFAKRFFKAYYGFENWQQRLPRVKIDYLNATLDIGYTMLFNFIEAMTRLFGFDPYMGVHHQLWFKRKSLICDLMEPFRCIIEHQIRKSIKYGTFKAADFELFKNAYYLKQEEKHKYIKIFFEAIVNHKSDIYNYMQQYYRCFMGRKSVNNYPKFSI